MPGFIAGLLTFFYALQGLAALQFDVFLGYDGIVPEAAWFPVVCEIKNDGPSFVGVVEVRSGNLTQGQTRRLLVELPTGTLKRVVIPVFSTARGFASWDVRLLDEKGKLRAEQPDQRPRRQLVAQTPLIGALARSAGGAPQVEPILPRGSELQPSSARLLPSIFPDNPLVLEGMSAFYLNSEKASELSAPQVEALLAWVRAGGHIIVAVEQPGDINASEWLKELFPFEVRGMRLVERHPELQEWVESAGWPSGSGVAGVPRSTGSGRNRGTGGISPESPFSDLADDLAFETNAMQVATGRLRNGNVEVAAGDVPLIVTAPRDRGRITALLFSPEREPMRSWKALPVFWARLAEVPGEYYIYSDFNQHGNWSADSIFGAMLDSRQVHKLPIGWLLLLLVVYLVVIGPFDHYWLKRIGRPMLTWITFPCYVVVFSLVIYFLGYKLRAGESEWNEMHVVDVLPGGGLAHFRGRTFVSVYSPANQRYSLESGQKYATLRGEYLRSYNANQNDDRTTVLQTGDRFKAEVFVPVWTSQLLVSDWWETGVAPVSVTVNKSGTGWQVQVRNLTERNLSNLHLVVDDRILPLKAVPAGRTVDMNLRADQGMALRDFASQHGQGFASAVQSRQHAFGQTEAGRIGDWPNSVIAASFLSQSPQYQHNQNMQFMGLPGLDLSKQVEQGTAFLLIWDAEFSPAKPLRQFTPKRIQKNTFWRVAVPVS